MKAFLVGGMVFVLIVSLCFFNTSVSYGYTDHLPNRVIVKFRETSMPVELINGHLISESHRLTTLLSQYTIIDYKQLFPLSGVAQTKADSAVTLIYLLVFADDDSYLDANSDLAHSPDIEYAHLDKFVFPLEVPNDPQVSDQWGLATIMAFKAWDVVHCNSNLPVAIIDSGIDKTHEDLIANFWQNPDETANGIDDDLNGMVDDLKGWDFVNDDADPDDDLNCNHGTHVGGIVAAVTNNSVGVSGLSWNGSLMNLRIMSYYAPMDTCTGSVSDSILAINYAVTQGAKVINMSFGHAGTIQAEEAVMNYAFNHGVVLVGAAGNEGTATNEYPGAYDVVISVGATNQSDKRAGFSNYGPAVDVMAPGTKIESTLMPNTYGEAGGTSMATPYVAALSLLLIAAGITDPTQIRNRITGGAENIDALNPGFEGMLGSGRINAYYSVVPTSLVEAIACSLSDIGGDDDTQADSNETVDITVQFMNKSWKDSTNAQAILIDAGSYCTINSGAINLGSIQTKTTTTPTETFQITVAPNAPSNSTIELHFSVTDDDGTALSIITISLNDPRPALPGWPKLGVTTDFNSSPVIFDLNEDSHNELILCDNSAHIHVWNAGGNYLSGWPVTLPDSDDNTTLATPAFGDVDNDGDIELVIASFRSPDSSTVPPIEAQGKVFMYHHNGILADGFPFICAGEIKTSPALSDLDGDGKLEIVVGSYDNNVYILKSDGSLLPSWPVAVGTDVFSSPAIADLNSDQKQEIIIALKDDQDPPQYGRLIVYDKSGQVQSGWPVDLPAQIYSSCAVADLDGDNDLEIVVGSGNYSGGEAGKLYAFHHTGLAVTGWPVSVPDTLYGSPSIGDIDDNGLLDIVIGCFDGKIYAFSATGTPLNGFPVETGGQIFSSPAIVDIDGDGYSEIFSGSDDGYVYGINYQGHLLEGYPVNTSGSIFSSVTVDDLDNDTDLEIVAANSIGNVYIWNDNRKSDHTFAWRKFRNTYENTGIYRATETYSPRINFLGFWNSAVSSQQGGTLQFLAWVQDHDSGSDQITVQLFYNGLPTGVFLADDGLNGDFGAQDGFYGLLLPIPPSALPTATFLFELQATDERGLTSSFAPYLEVP